MTGRAAVVLKTVFWSDDLHLTRVSCTGFTGCAGEPNNDTVGPVYVEIVP
jgi:hypothetical protein